MPAPVDGPLHAGPTRVRYRVLTRSDGAALRTATWINVNWSGAERLTFRDVDRLPDLRHYYEFHPDRGDLGVLAERDGAEDPGQRVVGVAWLLLLGTSGRERGYGYVEDGVPELSLCVWSGYRGHGLGGALLDRSLAAARDRGWSRVSLSVESGNPVVRLYRSRGFRPAAGAADGTYVVDLTAPHPA